MVNALPDGSNGPLTRCNACMMHGMMIGMSRCNDEKIVGSVKRNAKRHRLSYRSARRFVRSNHYMRLPYETRFIRNAAGVSLAKRTVTTASGI